MHRLPNGKPKQNSIRRCRSCGRARAGNHRPDVLMRPRRFPKTSAQRTKRRPRKLAQSHKMLILSPRSSRAFLAFPKRLSVSFFAFFSPLRAKSFRPWVFLHFFRYRKRQGYNPRQNPHVFHGRLRHGLRRLLIKSKKIHQADTARHGRPKPDAARYSTLRPAVTRP